MSIQHSSNERQRRRILVVANEAVTGDTLRKLLDLEPDDGSELLVVAPALTGRVAFWTSADDAARDVAAERLRRSLAELRAVDVAAEGMVGDADPLLAIDDALRLFPADEIVVATHTARDANWLERRVVTHARLRFAQPVHHVVPDAERVRVAA
jgi:hypothetical protein